MRKVWRFPGSLSLNKRITPSRLEDPNEKQLAEIYWRIGHYISSWSLIETEIILAISRITGSDPDHIGIMMYSNLNFGNWISITTDLLNNERLIYKNSLKMWNSKTSEIRALKDIRDQIAHNPVTIAPGNIQTNPAMLDRRIKSTKSKPLSVDELIRNSEKMLRLSRSLRDISKEIQRERDEAREQAKVRLEMLKSRSEDQPTQVASEQER